LFLSEVFDLPESGFRPHFYSLQPSPPHARAIRDWIRRSEALFFLLSDDMLDPAHSNYTRAWVGFEVGVASERGISVVVIEPSDHPVNLPVPGATHYLRRPPVTEEDMNTEWKAVASSGCSLYADILQGEDIPGLTPRRKWWGPKPSEFVGRMKFDSLRDLDLPPLVEAIESMGTFLRVVCGDPKCRATFLVARSGCRTRGFPCPTCRQRESFLRWKPVQ
jgi:hypothetical protein